MKVLLIGKTEADLFPFNGTSRHVMPGRAEGSEFEKRVKAGPGYAGQSGQELIEFAGRLCYESFSLPNPGTADNAGYVRNIVNLGHESVLEHVSVTFYVEGVSRNLTHELIRHRHLSFSEVSQRYVNMDEAKVITPPAYRDLWPENAQTYDLSEEHVDEYRYSTELLASKGKTRKQAREAARYGLPQGIETKLVVTGNLRAWRDVLKKRMTYLADAEMQEFAKAIWGQLIAEYPDVFEDIEFQEKP